MSGLEILIKVFDSAACIVSSSCHYSHTSIYFSSDLIGYFVFLITELKNIQISLRIMKQKEKKTIHTKEESKCICTVEFDIVQSHTGISV